MDVTTKMRFELLLVDGICRFLDAAKLLAADKVSVEFPRDNFEPRDLHLAIPLSEDDYAAIANGVTERLTMFSDGFVATVTYDHAEGSHCFVLSVTSVDDFSPAL
mgnify:CR=1 FL=1